MSKLSRRGAEDRKQRLKASRAASYPDQITCRPGLGPRRATPPLSSAAATPRRHGASGLRLLRPACQNTFCPASARATVARLTNAMTYSIDHEPSPLKYLRIRIARPEHCPSTLRPVSSYQTMTSIARRWHACVLAPRPTGMQARQRSRVSSPTPSPIICTPSALYTERSIHILHRERTSPRTST